MQTQTNASSTRHPATFKRDRAIALQTAEEISELTPNDLRRLEDLELEMEFAGFYGAKSLGGWM